MATSIAINHPSCPLPLLSLESPLRLFRLISDGPPRKYLTTPSATDGPHYPQRPNTLMSFFASLAASAWAGLLTLAFFIDVTYASCGHNVKLGNKVTTEVDSSTFTNVLPVQK